MKRFKNITLGGIQQKIVNLVLITLLLVMAVFSVMINYQMNHLNRLVADTNEKQKGSITSISQETMDAVIAQSLSSQTQMQAYIADDLFADTADTVKTLQDYTGLLFASPDQYSAREASLPDAALDGKGSVQLLTEADIDLDDPFIANKLGLIGNLSELMLSLYANAEVDSCYIALPEGVMLLVDDHASTKFDASGEIMPISVHERDWYQGAVQTGGLYFTDIVTDFFTEQYCVMCSAPVYVDGELVAVAGADLFLDNMEAYVNNSDENGGFTCIVNERGHVVFSPRTEGIFQVRGSEAEDLRTLGNAELAALIDDALVGATDVRPIEADGTSWYVTGAQIGSVGWTVLNLVDKAITDQPTLQMAAQYDGISSEAIASFSGNISHARTWMMVMLLFLAILAIASSVIVSTRIVKPLNIIVKRISELREGNLEFKMEDSYRTGDEVEELAQSFANISHKTVEYMDKVVQVTAEKERIGAELSLATQIQAAMLPHIVPAFPGRTDFDIIGSMDPAKEVGGDFYDYFLIDDNHLGMVIADVSGKGVPAALFMMASKIILQSVTMLGCSPAEVLRKTNEAICSTNEAGMFVTVWMGILELSTGRLTAANAGHEYPVFKRQDGNYELYKDRHGFVIGGMENVKYREYEMQLDPGAKLFVYTDGVPEATNADKELFGTQRMMDALNAEPDAAPQEVLKNVRASVDAFVKDAEQFDDLTMLCLEYKGPNGRDGERA